VDGVDLPGLDEVAEAQEGGDGQEALHPRGALAHHDAPLEAVHPADELPAHEQHGEQEAGLDDVPRPLDAALPPPERRALQDFRRTPGVEPDERPRLAEGGAGETGEGTGTHRGHGTSPGGGGHDGRHASRRLPGGSPRRDGRPEDRGLGMVVGLTRGSRRGQ
jgi:hypothetical protein